MTRPEWRTIALTKQQARRYRDLVLELEHEAEFGSAHGRFKRRRSNQRKVDLMELLRRLYVASMDR